MIHDYDGKEGFISLWIGKCKDYKVLDDYLSTVYLDEEYEGDEPGEEWKSIEGICIFFPENQDRSSKNNEGTQSTISSSNIWSWCFDIQFLFSTQYSGTSSS